MLILHDRTAETLKYFYLIFSDPGVISLDDYVLSVPVSASELSNH